MPRIISANLNGIRSAHKKGFFNWLAKQDADYIGVQELKCQEADMTEELLGPHGYHGHFHYAEKKGYSGTGVYSRSARASASAAPNSTPKAATPAATSAT